MKKIIFSVLMSSLFVPVYAQQYQVITVQGGEVGVNTAARARQKEIGKADMEFIYDYRRLTDTTDVSSEKKDLMILQISQGMSKFSSYRTMQVDSLISASTVDQIKANPGNYAGGETFSIYKNYPQGKLTTMDKIAMDWFMYEEDIPVQEWNIDDSATKEIAGYVCRRAECDFRGRKYIAWYTGEIPLAEGPWKFGGLPGLIMEVGDTEGHYQFTLTGINPNATRPVTIPDVQSNKTSRGKFYAAKRKYDTDPIGYISAVQGIKLTVTTPGGAPPSNEMMKPRELQYDYIERDYK
ncbi:MAG: GLPGLI family protein [Prevotellaceae bacterium]|jgi:GLPGLI family protein|nr:GLPGLI family protein [Prevotellaceae bacterium]